MPLANAFVYRVDLLAGKEKKFLNLFDYLENNELIDNYVFYLLILTTTVGLVLCIHMERMGIFL